MGEKEIGKIIVTLLEAAIEIVKAVTNTED